MMTEVGVRTLVGKRSRCRKRWRKVEDVESVLVTLPAVCVGVENHAFFG